MNIKDINNWKSENKENKDKVLYVRIPMKYFQWLKENKVSIKKFVNCALEEVIKQEKPKKE
jgi:hypothetical protein